MKIQKETAGNKKIQAGTVLLLFSAAALLCTKGTIPLFYGLIFSFGSVFLIIAVQLFGLWAGLFSAVVVSVLTLTTGHSYLLPLLGLLEVGWLGLFGRKNKNNLLVNDGLFWLIAGMPILLLSLRSFNYSAVMMLILVIIIMNRLLNALLADILLSYLPLPYWCGLTGRYKYQYHFRKLLFHLTIGAVAVPYFLFFLMNSWYLSRSETQSAYQLTMSTAQSIEGQISEWSDQDRMKLKLDGFIQSGMIQRIIKTRTSGTPYHIMITDRKHRELAGNEDFQFMNAYSSNPKNKLTKVQNDFYLSLPSGQMNIPMKAWLQGQYIYSTVMTQVPLTITVSLPVIDEQQSVFKQYIYEFRYLLLFVILAVILAILINRVLLRSLSQLAAATSGLPDNLQDSKAIELPNSRIFEIKVLTSNVMEMAVRLSGMFHKIKETNEQLHQQTEKLQISEKELHYHAHYDVLTGLPNRYSFTTYLQELLDRENPDSSITIIYADLNRFKEINDTLGHAAGDELLHVVSELLKTKLDENSRLFRMGGDEFVIVIDDSSPAGAVRTAEMMMSAFEQPIILNNIPFYTSVSIGISFYPQDGNDMGTLIKCADIAMYQAKEDVGNAYRVYDHRLDEAFYEKILLENGMHEALKNNQFRLHYQPLIDKKTRTVNGVEALIRWHHPEQGDIPPDRFIPLAEETGLIVDIDHWVLKEACRQNKAWQDSGLPGIPVAVNLSGSHFHERNIVQRVESILDEAGLDAKYLTLEITENVFIEHTDHAIDILTRMRNMGIRISIDDFGTGYSSLHQLQRLPVDYIKLDRVFVQNVDQDIRKTSIAHAIIEMAHSMNLQVLGEGVENAGELECLINQHCDSFQGYYFSKPVSVQKIPELLRRTFSLRDSDKPSSFRQGGRT